MITGIVSPYSFEGSVLKIELAVKHARSLGAKTLFLCDTNFHGTVEFIKSCKKYNINPIIGLRLKDKVLYARNTEEFYQLINAYNRNDFKNLKLPEIPLEEIKLVYHLPGQKAAYEFFARYFGKEPVKNAEFNSYKDALECKGYNLYSSQKLPGAPKDFFKVLETNIKSYERERFEREKALIIKLGFVDYFYTIFDIVTTARKLGIKVGPGRGSAVGSFIAYKLGITEINPLKYNLMFERFLNEGRKELPDIDLDIEDERRKELIEQLREKYRYVYHITTYSNAGEKFIKKIVSENNIPRKIAEYILGLPLHKSIHAAGIIISTVPLNAPVISGEYTLEWDMNSLQQCGFVKIDILGLKTLSILSKLEKKFGRIKNLDDKNVYKKISTGETTGIFQLDSTIARKISRRIKPKSLEELAVVLSLNRPGPLKSGLDKQYVLSKKNTNSTLSNIFDETRGVLIYQEQIMRIAMNLANFSAEEADALRKAVSKKDKELMNSLIKKLRINLSQKMEKEEVNNLIKTIYDFSEYAFNKSHAVAYSHISYFLSYFKLYFPKDFFRVLISYDSQKIAASIYELQALGYKILLPNINNKKENENEFIIPLSCISGIGKNTEEQIRKSAPYTSFENFVEKNKTLHYSTIEALIKAGAFDDFSSSRRKLLKKLKDFRVGINPQLLDISSKLFGKKLEHDIKIEKEWEKADMENSVLGVPITKPVENVENNLSPYCVAFSRQQKLATHIVVKGGYATDGISVFKITVPDGKYTYVYEKNLTIYEGFKKVEYILKEFLSENDLERGGKMESVKFKYNRKKYAVLKSRPVLDEYTINIV
ncbi:DNA polymerase III subunit alpha [Thermosipho ferrireducens]|uniref:DNA-directed DNA polymerase n=1 Tax=Thermosipho ferrireducens TaxID=2571116 RepID=A0ABX7S5C9_9BACT|nr:PHP domain-containing protein [Thermosipho ferrireducens]QTA37737.1 DNA polymerase III subunit alpha [Thermosipho ferrireducens]